MQLSQLNVQSVGGEAVTLDQVSQGKAGIMVLVRHYGCIFCRQRIAELISESKSRPEFDLTIFVVGNGTAAMAADFVSTHGINVPVFTDPSREIYRKLGMKRMFGINWTSVKQGLAAFKDGHRQTAVAGDVWQQGGVAVFDTQGHVNYVFADQEAGSALPWSEVWQAVASHGSPS